MEVGQNIFTAVLGLDGTIYDGRSQRPVGIDNQREQEYIKQIADMTEVLDNYYSKLVELGAIVPEKTAEEIAREAAEEQTAINRALLNAIESLQTEIVSLKSTATPAVASGASATSRSSKGQFVKKETKEDIEVVADV